MKWAITEKFCPYLCGYKFHVVMDSNPLMYLVTSTKLSATDHLWLSGLVLLDFMIVYQAGKPHSDADSLSCVLYTLSLGAGTVQDKDYVKTFLDKLSPEEALHVCPWRPFRLFVSTTRCWSHSIPTTSLSQWYKQSACHLRQWTTLSGG